MTTKIKCIGCRNYLLKDNEVNYTIEFEIDVERDELGKLTNVLRGKYLVCKNCGRKIDVNKIRDDLWNELWNKLVERGFKDDNRQKSELSRGVSKDRPKDSDKGSSKRRNKNKRIQNKS